MKEKIPFPNSKKCFFLRKSFGERKKKDSAEWRIQEVGGRKKEIRVGELKREARMRMREQSTIRWMYDGRRIE